MRRSLAHTKLLTRKALFSTFPRSLFTPTQTSSIFLSNSRISHFIPSSKTTRSFYSSPLPRSQTTDLTPTSQAQATEAANSSRLRITQGHQSMIEGNLDDALHHYSQAILHTPTAPMPLFFRAGVYSELQKTDDCLRDVNEALRYALAPETRCVDEEIGEMLKLRAWALIQLRKYDDARLTLQQAEKRFPNSAEFFDQIAEINDLLAEVNRLHRDSKISWVVGKGVRKEEGLYALVSESTRGRVRVGTSEQISERAGSSTSYSGSGRGLFLAEGQGKVSAGDIVFSESPLVASADTAHAVKFFFFFF